jgi:dCTP deaminase
MKTKQLEQLLLTGVGALPFQAIETLKEYQLIKDSPLKAGPASLDLVLTDECYEIKRVIFPKQGQEVYSLINKEMGSKRHKGNVLFPGKQYIISHQEGFELPRELYGYSNPKSTTGRSFTHIRLFADGVSQYDHLPRGWRGKAWSLVTPKLFPILYRPGIDSLNQMRILRKDARLSELEIRRMQGQYSALKDENNKRKQANTLRIRGGDHGYMIFSADCVGVDGIVGYEAKVSKEALPIGGVHCSDWKKYFKPIKAKKYLELDPAKYYILSTSERISIPPQFAAEVKAIDERHGEFRTHYAGFFDPGFGYDSTNPLAGNTITLEVRVFEKTCLWHGQPVACLQFEHMAAIPESLYDKTSGTYKKQIGATLGKQFNMKK